MRYVLVAALAAVLVVPAASAAAPRIVLVKSSPLVVAGSHFKPRERVTVTLGQTTRQVRATTLGSFQASFGGIVLDRCSAWSVAAVGALGDRAVLLRPRAMCAPASGE